MIMARSRHWHRVRNPDFRRLVVDGDVGSPSTVKQQLSAEPSSAPHTLGAAGAPVVNGSSSVVDNPDMARMPRVIGLSVCLSPSPHGAQGAQGTPQGPAAGAGAGGARGLGAAETKLAEEKVLHCGAQAAPVTLAISRLL